MIRVQNLGKRYRIGQLRPGRNTIREAITGSIASRFKRLARLGKAPLPEELVWAIRDVSFEVSQGEVLGIVGKNGAGKSTLLKILARVTPPTEGRAELFGRLSSLLEVGTGFHPELTGRQNIFLNGAILGMKRAEIQRRFDDIVNFAEIERFIDTPVKRYSSGMYVRLAFAVEAHLDPDILLVDEVLSIGDEAFKRKCLGHMKDASHAGRTVLFVSHNMAAIRLLCSNAVHLEAGKLAHWGKVEDVVDAYLGSQDSSEPTRQWPAQKTESPLAPLEFTLLDGKGGPCVNCTTGDKIGFFLAIQINRPTRFSVCIKIHGADGTPIFSVSHSIPDEIDPKDTEPKLETGIYNLTSTIQTPQLEQGLYYASLTIEHTMWGNFFHEEKVIEWTVTNLSSDKPQRIRKPGYVKASSKWRVERANK
ncbi:MAG: ABC transporter ATP-binding protein [Pseudomonadota bacterium]